MLSSDIPTRLPLPFAASAGGGYIRSIPVASQIGIDDGAASLTDGFVPLNATPIGAGGIPPDIKDMNGILFEISGWTRWVAAGGPVFYDSAFATAIGGYPKGGVVQSATLPGVFFVSTADSNTTDPEGGSPANWSTLIPAAADNATTLAGVDAAKFVTPASLASLRTSTADILAGTAAGKLLTPSSFYGARASGADILAGTDDHRYLTAFGLAAAFDPANRIEVVARLIAFPNGFMKFSNGVYIIWGTFTAATRNSTSFSYSTIDASITPAIGSVAVVSGVPSGQVAGNNPQNNWPSVVSASAAGFTAWNGDNSCTTQFIAIAA